jgi:signal transduction histidine kinase
MAWARATVLGRALVAVLLPLAAYTIQVVLWPLLSPYAWLLSFPTVLLAAAVGGFWSGIGATLLLAMLVSWRFVPPEASFQIASPKHLLSIGIFIFVGFAVSVFQGRLQRATQQLHRSHRRAQFLAEAGAILASTLDYEETLTSVANLAVSEFADVCLIDLIDESGNVLRLRVAARDPDLKRAGEILNDSLDRSRRYMTAETLQTQSPVLMQQLSPDVIDGFAQGSPERLRALRAINPKSVITVPLVARGNSFGALAFVSVASSAPFTTEDLQLAEALALRAALSIDNARLYRLAQRALQARDEILGIVAHDLRSPLNAIVLNAQLLGRSGGARADAQDSVAAIGRAAERMSRMIRDLLDIACIEAGQLGIDRSSVPTRELILDAVEAQKSMAAAASLELQVEVTHDVPDVWADRNRLLQVFDNLIGNAIKFTAPGGRVAIGAALKADQVHFWVVDTGVGIDRDDLLHLFDRFWQARKGEYHGAGLGLPIARGIVEAHGGRISVESTLGVGTGFFFTIPSASAADLGPAEGAAFPLPAGAGPPNSSPAPAGLEKPATEVLEEQPR